MGKNKKTRKRKVRHQAKMNIIEDDRKRAIAQRQHMTTYGGDYRLLENTSFKALRLSIFRDTENFLSSSGKPREYFHPETDLFVYKGGPFHIRKHTLVYDFHGPNLYVGSEKKLFEHYTYSHGDPYEFSNDIVKRFKKNIDEYKARFLVLEFHDKVGGDDSVFRIVKDNVSKDLENKIDTFETKLEEWKSKRFMPKERYFADSEVYGKD